MTIQAPAGSSQFPYRHESEDHARPWFCLVLVSFGSIQFPHRFESEDHTRPWFCLVLRIFGSIQFPYRFETEDYARPWFYLVFRIFPQYKTDNHNGPKNLNQRNAFANNNRFLGYLHSKGEVQLFHLSPLSSMHIFLLLK